MGEEVQGLTELMANLTRLGEVAMDEILGEELLLEGELMMTDSKENYVPVDFGTLRSTGVVTGPKKERGGLVVMLSYGGPAAPYALAVHENPRSGKTGGVSPSGKPYKHFARVGQWKFLETPVAKARGGMLARMGARMWGRIEGLVRK